MYAIASLFDHASAKAVHALWERFEQRCGLVSAQKEPLPHISWTAADSFLFPPLEAELSALAKAEHEPFTLRTAGMGIFTGPVPVVYIAVIKDQDALAFHNKVWELARPYAVVPNPYYRPDRWVPHITLAYHPVDAAQLGCAIADISFQRIEMEITIGNLALITNNLGQSGVKKQFKFKKG